MRILIAPAILCCLSLSALAQDPPAPATPSLKLPTEVKAPPATITDLKAETAGKVVEWVTLTPGLSLRPVDGGRLLLFSGPTGRYELLAYTAVGDVPSKPARVVVVIGDPPVPPSPGPGPNPPKPDALTERVKKAFGADPEADPAKKAALAKSLATLYRELAKEAAESPSADEFRRVARETAKSMIGDALIGVRQAVSAELALLLPTDAAFAGTQRDAVASLFTRLATILEGL